MAGFGFIAEATGVTTAEGFVLDVAFPLHVALVTVGEVATAGVFAGVAIGVARVLAGVTIGVAGVLAGVTIGVAGDFAGVTIGVAGVFAGVTIGVAEVVAGVATGVAFGALADGSTFVGAASA